MEEDDEDEEKEEKTIEEAEEDDKEEEDEVITEEAIEEEAAAAEEGTKEEMAPVAVFNRNFKEEAVNCSFAKITPEYAENENRQTAKQINSRRANRSSSTESKSNAGQRGRKSY